MLISTGKQENCPVDIASHQKTWKIWIWSASYVESLHKCLIECHFLERISATRMKSAGQRQCAQNKGRGRTWVYCCLDDYEAGLCLDGCFESCHTNLHELVLCETAVKTSIYSIWSQSYLNLNTSILLQKLKRYLKILPQSRV